MLNKFDVVHCRSRGVMMAVVLLGPLSVPSFHDGIASHFAFKPLDIQDPEEWKEEYEAYICFDLLAQKYVVLPGEDTNETKKFDGEIGDGYIPFDHGTARLRTILGLIKLAEKWYGKSNYLEKHLKP